MNTTGSGALGQRRAGKSRCTLHSEMHRAVCRPVADNEYNTIFREAYVSSSLHEIYPCSIHKEHLPQNRIITKRSIQK